MMQVAPHSPGSHAPADIRARVLLMQQLSTGAFLTIENSSSLATTKDLRGRVFLGST